MLLKNILFLAAGGAAGTILRYLGQKYISVGTSSFPYPTFLINVLGCFLIGILYSIWVKNQSANEDMRMLLMTGFCGGFTTFSAFSLEGMRLIQQEKILIFFVYFAASVIIGLLATFAGAWLAR